MTDDHILIIKLGALGDIVQAEGAVHDIRLAHPDSKITVMTTPPYRKLFERCPWIDQVVIDPRHSRFRIDRMLALRRILRGHEFNMVYDLQQVSRTDFYARFLLKGTPWLGGVRGCTHYCRRPDDRCAADHFRISFEKAGLEAVHTLVSDVTWMAEEMSGFLRQYGLAGDFIVLIPGCSKKHPYKRWPYYRELASRLCDEGLRVVTVPGPDEIELCREITGDMLLSGGRWLDYFELAGVLKEARYIVGNDTGPTHIGAHLRCDGLALFGSHSDPLHTGIQHSRFKWLEDNDISSIPVDKVVQTVLQDVS
ncbi:glycosyltransferase family 9 protein [Desulfopila sp. IMCC35008]|uniref:glycosyltransferase family 9 protein n=1 Tax=Desulfopila sp. IMCC35008 TaxID=2653858 RepID=UPI0013D08D67|nr:glycosyltransferase family 9 protein [Desulfopila sp. IMCC35008]